MQQGYGIIVLLILCAFIATVEYVFIKNREGSSGTVVKCIQRYAFHVFSLFFATFFFVMSAVKYYLGYQVESLFESFWNMQLVTFVHYGIPMLLMAVIGPVIVVFVFRGFEWRIIRFFNSSMFFTLVYAYFLVRKISNKVYCTAFVIALCATLFAIFYLKKHDIFYASDGNMKKEIVEKLPFVLFWGVLIAFYTPNELYLNNASDFPISYWYFFGKLFLSCVLMMVLIMAGMLLYLTRKQLDIFCTLLFSILMMGYVQGAFLNGDMGSLDGSEHVWETSQIVLNLLIWILCVVILMALTVWKMKTVQKVMRVVCVWIVLTQIVSLGVLIISSDDTQSKSELLLTTDGILEVGEEKNVIVFVLDMFDGRRMDDILEKNPAFLEPLKDFTYYRNATSEFFPTDNCIPFLLTGTEFNEDLLGWYPSYAYDEDALLMDIYENGYDVCLYTKERYVPEALKQIVSNYKEGVERTCDFWELHSLMTQCSRYSMAPFWAKGYYVYDTSDISLLTVDERITNVEDDIPFYNVLTRDGLSVKEGEERKNKFSFFHMHGAHPPYTMTDEFQYIEYDARRGLGVHADGDLQAMGAMKIVYEYLEQLKELGKYDDATIIITADHGTVESLVDEDGNKVQASIPILFVKEANQKKEEIYITEAPVCHEDIIPTVRKEMGMNVDEKTLADYVEGEERTRIFRVRDENSYEKWQVIGNVREFESWELLKSVEQ